MLVDTSTIAWLWPEITLILWASGLFLAGTFGTPRPHAWTWAALAGYLAAAAILLGYEYPAAQTMATSGPAAFNGPLVIDSLSWVLRLFSLAVGAGFTLLIAKVGHQRLRTEVLGAVMLISAGNMLLSRANELVLLFVALETVSIPTYILLFLGRGDRGSAESTVKYFFLSIFSSAMFLYGLSFVYGMAGTTLIGGPEGGEMVTIRAALSAPGNAAIALLPIAYVLLLAGLGFKIAAAPFHFYAPDVYQSTTNINAGLLSVAPKIAGIIALVRLVVAVMPADAAIGWQLVLVLSVISMTIGNACALWQQNLRRLMAYSSIAHAGYMLIGFSVALTHVETLGYGGIAASTLYLVVYAAASVGIFAALVYLGDEERDVSTVSELAGLAQRHPAVAGGLAVCLFSLAGIPPLAGFWGKLSLFSGAISLSLTGETAETQGWFSLLAVVAAVNAAIAAAYYLRVVAAIYFQPTPPSELPAQGGQTALAALGLCTLLVVAIGVAPSYAFSLLQPATPPAAVGADVVEGGEAPQDALARHPGTQETSPRLARQ